jgi:hypothetical protein
MPAQQSLSWPQAKPPAVLQTPAQQVCSWLHVPAHVPLAQLSHGPQAALPQQNPPTQFPLWHWPPRSHVLPFACWGWHSRCAVQ